MKPTQTGAGGARKEGVYSNANTQQPQYAHTPNQGGSQPQPAGPLANYTLPGVIGYLTSEFTNLERFKIVTNLEKSEMRYRIQQLTSELNSVRFVNEKQALRIKLLEEKLETAKGENSEKKESLSTNSGSASEKGTDSQSGSLSNGDFVSENEKSLRNLHITKDLAPSQANGKSTPPDSSASIEIPHVDLEYLRNSRQKLNKSIREIVDLLEPPSGIDFLDMHSGSATRSNFEDLLVDKRRDSLDPEHEDVRKPRESVFARYTLSRDDLQNQKITFENDAAETPAATGPDLGQPWEQSRHENMATDESDTETVTIDEPDLIGILSNGTDAQMPE
ncbi:hypothetical protein OXX69_005559 [Metschnikowia pulcherrima]